jgi:hypothetical protein
LQQLLQSSRQRECAKVNSPTASPDSSAVPCTREVEGAPGSIRDLAKGRRCSVCSCENPPQ